VVQYIARKTAQWRKKALSAGSRSNSDGSLR
jgi:hypothetical protein